MAYEITRSYDTDFSRDDVRAILANVAKRLNDARGRDIPTKTVFETPDLVDEDENLFAVDVRPTVADAGFGPADLIPSGVVYDDMYVRLIGYEGETAHVYVHEAGGSERDPDLETLERIWAKLD